MTSNNKSVSRQNLWSGNFAKSMTVTVHCSIPANVDLRPSLQRGLMNFQLQERFSGNKINCLPITIWTNDENFMCPDQNKTGHVTDKCIKLIRKRWIHLRRHRRRMWWRGREVTTVVSYWWLFCFIGSANNHDNLLLRMKTTCKVFHSRPFSKALSVRVYCS